MKPVLIDFVPDGPARMLARTGLLTWLALAVGAAMCVSAWSGMQTLRAEQAALAGQDARRWRSSAPPPVAVTTLAPARVSAVNRIVMQLNLPWEALRTSLANAATPGVALLALEPDARHGGVHLSARARDADAMVRYVARLKRQPSLRAVVLNQHERDPEENTDGLRFELTLTWEHT